MIRFVRGRLARAEIDAPTSTDPRLIPRGAASEAERLPLEHDVCPERQAAARLLGELDRQFQFSDAVAHPRAPPQTMIRPLETVSRSAANLISG